MIFIKNYVCILLTYFTAISVMPKMVEGLSKRDMEAEAFLESIEKDYSKQCNQANLISYKYLTNMTDANDKANIEIQDSFALYQAKIQTRAIKEFPDWKELSPKLKREMYYVIIGGAGEGVEADVAATNKLESQMQSGYSKATVCEYKNPTKCDLHLDPELTSILETSTNPEELAYYWNAWHDATSKTITPNIYSTYIHHSNRIAKNVGFDTVTGFWLSSYDEETPGWTPQKFIDDMTAIWEQIKPKYKILYAYVRMKLRSNSPFRDHIERCGKIPFHFTGNMWGQAWSSLEKYTVPFPKAPSLDATPYMIQQGYTPKKMFQVADEFIQSLGLYKMTDTFWKESMLERPVGRDVACHPTAHDLCIGRGSSDFRIKMCTSINQKDLITIHHEMGHVEYYQQATDLRYTFRQGANPGFHEAIGDTLALAVTTPEHLQCVLKFPLGLDLNCTKGKGPSTAPPVVTETDINHLFKNAIDKVPVIAFAMAVDEWRFAVFDGKIKPEDYGRKWWEIRMKYQDLKMPNPRDPTKFDPSAKHHIPSNVEYIRYFFSNIVQFSFYEAMCIAAKEFDPNNPNSKPLYQCDFTGSKEAGKLLGDVLKLGFEEPWPVALKMITGHGKLKADSILNYFKPLFDKLEAELKANGESDCL